MLSVEPTSPHRTHKSAMIIDGTKSVKTQLSQYTHRFNPSVNRYCLVFETFSFVTRVAPFVIRGEYDTSTIRQISMESVGAMAFFSHPGRTFERSVTLRPSAPGPLCSVDKSSAL